MRTAFGQKWIWTTIGVCVLAFVVLPGCQTQRALSYRQSMDDGVKAVQAGEFDQAKQCLAEAKNNSDNFEQQRQVESMEKLVDGARAMMDGEMSVAKAEWSAIRDPHLNREVRKKAESVVGIEVPMVPQRKEN